MSEKQVVMYNSEEAAKFVTGISGWVSRDGHFFGNHKESEGMARYAGCTHIACEDCGSPVEKGWVRCETCREKKLDESFSKKQRVIWDGTTPIVIYDSDTYFFSEDDLFEYCEENEIELSSLRLMLCKPIYLPELCESFYEDDLPEDGELPEDIKDAMEEFNKVVRVCNKNPISWEVGEFAVSNYEAKKGGE